MYAHPDALKAMFKCVGDSLRVSLYVAFSGVVYCHCVNECANMLGCGCRLGDKLTNAFPQLALL